MEMNTTHVTSSLFHKKVNVEFGLGKTAELYRIGVSYFLCFSFIIVYFHMCWWRLFLEYDTRTSQLPRMSFIGAR